MLSAARRSRLFLQQPLPLSSAAAPRILLPDCAAAARVCRCSAFCRLCSLRDDGHSIAGGRAEPLPLAAPRDLPVFRWWSTGGSVRQVCYDRSQNRKGDKRDGFIRVRTNTAPQLSLQQQPQNLYVVLISFKKIVETFIAQVSCGCWEGGGAALQSLPALPTSAVRRGCVTQPAPTQWCSDGQVHRSKERVKGSVLLAPCS